MSNKYIFEVLYNARIIQNGYMHGKHVSRIIGIVAVLKKQITELPIHTKSVINIISMGEEWTVFFIFIVIFPMATILVEY